MPHVEINCYPGRTEEIKKDCAEKVASLVAGSLGCNLSSVSVSIKEIPQEEWKDKIYDGRLMADTDSLYVKPGYTCE